MNRGSLLLQLAALFSLSLSGAEILPPGHRPVPPGVHALTGGKVVPRPGEPMDDAVIVIRDGFIQAVGKDVNPPPDARIWDMQGLIIYAGLIDPCLILSAATNAPAATDTAEDLSLTAGRINFFGVPGQERDPGGAGVGSELSPITPQKRVAETFAPSPRALEALRELGFTAGNVSPAKGIIRGTSAFVLLSDANPNDAILKTDVFQHVAFDAEEGRDGAYPRSLMGVIAAVRQTLFNARHYARDHEHYQRSPRGRKRPEFNPALEALAPAIGRTMPVVIEPDSVLMVDRAARVAREQELEFLLISSGQEWRRPEFARAAGVPFIVPVNFPELSKLPDEDDWEQVMLDQLRAWDWAPENAALLRRRGIEVALTTFGLSDRKNFRKNVRLAIDRGLSETDALAALTTVPAKLCGVDQQLGTIEPGKIANLTVVDGQGYFDPEAKVREVWIDGRVYPITPEKKKDSKSTEPEKGGPDADKAKSRKKESEELRKKLTARPPQEGRGPIAERPAILVRGATIWTCGPQGRIENADLLIEEGKVKAVGKNLKASPAFADQVLVIEGEGRHVTPGLVDAHSHAMILGGVNEGTIPSTAMVRIGDVVNSETDNIHKELAGGLTVANLLHGSANPIGGQNSIIKLRDGAAPEDLKFADAPPGIKFALGENVKQSNWGERNVTRFPQTRMGVRTFMANRFTAARQYLKEWEEFNRSGGAPVPRDLELEAIGEIIEGKRWIHCHSYRQDEILVFLRLMESFGVKVGTLQHVLEGYKIADEIAKHGAGASCFADWWAYKFEVYDAIPYAGSLMRERGVVVSFNSDSSDLSRRLYLEAAKAVKYGGTPEEEALKFVTLNPARQLRIDGRVGSLEPGKDGDFALWSKPPLDSGTVCLQTWIDGKKYFDREREEERSSALEKERNELLAKAKKILGVTGGDEGGQAEKDKFFERALEHRFDGIERHCLEEER